MANCYNGLAVKHIDAGLLDFAEDILYKALALAPDHAVAKKNLSFVLMLKGIDKGNKEDDFAGAAELLNKAIELDPANEKAKGNLALCIEELSKQQEGGAAVEGVGSKQNDLGASEELELSLKEDAANLVGESSITSD